MTPLRFLVLALAILWAATSSAASPDGAAQDVRLRLATTTSTDDTGLLRVLLADFERQCGCQVDVVAVGTGQALQLGRRGDVDVVLVHARAAEDVFVAEGHATRRDDVMYNDFVIVGPKADSAKVAGSSSARRAFEAIAATGAPFASRGDRSGTHTKELALWKAAGVSPTGAQRWYLSVGQGMGNTLTFAHEREAYTLTDRATWLSMRARLPGLVLLFGGESLASNPDRSLRNGYGVLPVNPAVHPSVHAALADRFVTWLLSSPTQRRIGEFGRETFGQPLFYPDSDEYKARREVTVRSGLVSRTFTLADLKALPRIAIPDHEVVGVKRGPLGRHTWAGASLKDVLLAVDPTLARAAGAGKRVVVESSDGWTAVLKWAEVFGALPRGEALYNVKGCNECHGVDAEGTSPPGKAPAPRLAGRAFDTAALTRLLHSGAGHADISAYTPARITEADVRDIMAWLDPASPPRRGLPYVVAGIKQSVLLAYERDGADLSARDGLIQLVVGVDEFASRFSHWVSAIRVESIGRPQ
ncbi:MAG: substrate-binding domain-containing protein [Acidobacteriota bacterium]